jgi:hypothetical protein
MSNENKVNVNFGSSLLLVLGTILLILKLAEVIQWSWWIVLIPFYPLFLALSILILLGLVVGIANLVEMIGEKKLKRLVKK